MAAVSTSVSTRLGATAASAGAALCYMRISTTVKKVLPPYYSSPLPAEEHVITLFGWSDTWTTFNPNNLTHTSQLAVITLSTVWAAPLPAPTGQISTRARRPAPGHSPPLQATASKSWVPLLPSECDTSIRSFSTGGCCGVQLEFTDVRSCCGSFNMWRFLAPFCYRLSLCQLCHQSVIDM